MSYEILKNRLTNGTQFLKQNAIDRINALADSLEITQEEAEKLLSLAESNGSDVLDSNVMERLERIEKIVNTFFEVAKNSIAFGSIISSIEEKLSEQKVG